VRVPVVLDQAYDADQSVITKSDADGVHLSSVSAPFVQAAMIDQAGVRPGMRVLEVGSGGYQAALLAEVTGPGGHMVTMDIDPEVTGRTRELREHTGHASRVTVVTGDAAGGAPGHGEFDAIIVTCGAWDIPPAWTGQLVPGTGTLVVPLRMNGNTRSVAFRQRGSHWSSVSHVYCGFVPIRGEGAFAVQAFRLPRPDGGEVTLRFETGAPDDPALLDGVLATPQVTRWSGVPFPSGVPYGGLELWLGGFQPGFRRSSAGGKGGKSWVRYGAAVRDSVGVLAQRWRDDAGMFEFGAARLQRHGERRPRLRQLAAEPVLVPVGAVRGDRPESEPRRLRPDRKTGADLQLGPEPRVALSLREVPGRVYGTACTG
jgi:protein-L-isoaspartate(D-aspartate) O-methyltransferase